jgi:hypothetical protein
MQHSLSAFTRPDRGACLFPPLVYTPAAHVRPLYRGAPIMILRMI